MDDSTFIKQTFAQRLRGLREAAGLTQQELGDKLGYSRGSISYYEKCERSPDIVFLDAVCMFFDVNPNFMLGYSENKKAANEDIGLRFGLTDKSIEILESMDLIDYRDFLSAFIGHNLFPKLFECMTLYDWAVDYGEVSLHTALDEHEFRHFQITRIIMTILDDIQKDLVTCGRVIKSIDDASETKRIQFYKAVLEQERANADRITAKYEATIEEHNRQVRKEYDMWNEQEEENHRIRIAAQSYVEAVASSEESENGNH